MNNQIFSSGFRTTDPTKGVTILRSAEDQTEIMTIPALFKRTAEAHGSHTALMYKEETSKKWIGISYKEYRERVEKMAKVFIKLGLERHGTVAVLAFNSVEWFVSNLGAIHAGGIIAGIYTTNSVDSCFHILETSKANIVVVDDAEQLKKILEIKDKLPHLKAVVQTLSPPSQSLSSSDGYWRWSELEAMDTEDVEEEYKMRLNAVVANECCCLIYTSGTTGKSKGVMLSHDNICINTSFVQNVLNLRKAQERFISYMPLSHVTAQIVEIFLPLVVAVTVYFADKNAMKETLLKIIVDVRPTFLVGVPRIFEKIQDCMMSVSAQSDTLLGFIENWAKRVILKHNLNCMTGYKPGSIQYKLAKKLVINKAKEVIGLENCRNLFTCSAPMNNETKKYFMSVDLIVREGFGLSETAGPHCLCPENFKSYETVGKSSLYTLTKIINPDEKGHGEICIKGRHLFMGYLNDVEKTLEAFDDEGWLRTGDIGYLDEEGYLFITGRIKELIITAGGENIPAILIEDTVKRECPALSNTILIGDKRKFLTMLVTLKTEMNSDGAPRDELSSQTLKWLEGMDLKYTKLSEVLAAGPDAKVLGAIQEAIIRANAVAISRAQKVQKFAILPHDFSVPTGELGPTMKLRRNFVVEKYNDVIEKFYS